MAIVNGTYVPDPVGSVEDLQNQYFGEYSKHDMADYSEAALQIRLKELENAYNWDAWKAQNEYNTPAAQMQRYQDAGLNPNLIYHQSNTAGDVKSASAAQPSSSGTYAKNAQTLMNGIGQLLSAVKAGVNLYDYVNYGAPREKSELNLLDQQIFGEHARNNILSYQATQEAYKTLWEQWLHYDPNANGLLQGYNSGEEGDVRPPDLSNTPRGRAYQLQQMSQEAKYEQLLLIASLIPEQEARQKALTAIEGMKLAIMRGENDAILNIDTGNEMWNAVLKSFILTMKGATGGLLSLAGKAFF